MRRAAAFIGAVRDGRGYEAYEGVRERNRLTTVIMVKVPMATLECYARISAEQAGGAQSGGTQVGNLKGNSFVKRQMCSLEAGYRKVEDAGGGASELVVPCGDSHPLAMSPQCSYCVQAAANASRRRDAEAKRAQELDAKYICAELCDAGTPNAGEAGGTVGFNATEGSECRITG